jgi:ribosomal protein S18 acetylase RimI-like enzyme
VIRAATAEDARAIAELEVRAWRWAYVDFVDDGDMPTVEERTERWRDEPRDGAFVAEVAGRVVGVVQVGADGATGRLRGLYVDPAAQGAGLGAALHEHALAELTAGGFAEATLEVFAANGHARGFYERRGWTADGAADDWAGVPGVRYRHRLSG